MIEKLERMMVSADGYDLCVSCSKKTQYPTNTHVDARIGYVEGVGQLCIECYKKVSQEGSI